MEAPCGQPVRGSLVRRASRARENCRRGSSTNGFPGTLVGPIIAGSPVTSRSRAHVTATVLLAGSMITSAWQERGIRGQLLPPITVAANDSYEPNNDRASAPTISPSTYYYSYIFNSRDKDHYKVVPATAGSMTITLTNLPQNYNLQLLNSSGTILASSTNTGTTNEQIVYTVTAYSTYTLRYTVTPS